MTTIERSDLFSGFAAATWRATDQLRINLGGRYTRVKKRDNRTTQIGRAGSIPSDDNFVPLTVGLTQLYAATGVNAGNYATPKRSDDAFLPSASIQYELARAVMAYASYTQGFKAGGYSIGTTNSSFDPERVKSYEIGLKADLFDRLLTVNLAGFTGLYRNLQETATVVSGATVRQIVTNAAKSRVKGIEIATVLRPVSQLSISTNIAYLSSRYVDYPNAPCTTIQQVASAVCSQNLSGARRAFAPKWSGNVAVDYSYPIGDYALNLSANTYFTTRFLQIATGDYRISQPRNAKVDARIGFGPEDGQWEVAVVGKNLTNKLTASYRQVAPGATGSLAALADAPRSIGAQASFRF